MATVVVSVEILVDLVCLVDCLDSAPNLPKMLSGDVVTDTSKLTLNSNSVAVVGSRLNRIKRRTTLRVRIVVVVMEIASTMVVPSGSGVDESRRV